MVVVVGAAVVTEAVVVVVVVVKKGTEERPVDRGGEKQRFKEVCRTRAPEISWRRTCETFDKSPHE